MGGGRARPVVTLLAAAVLVAGCAEDTPVPVAAPSVTPAPSPSPTLPPRTPVSGTVETTTTDTSRRTRLGLDEDGEPSPGSTEAAVAAVATSLDAWLEAAQAGTADLDRLGAAWLVEEDPAAAEVLRSGITRPDNPVASASYLLDVHLEPDPTTVVARVDVGRLDGSRARVELVLDVTGPRPVLLLVGTPEDA